MNKERLQRIRDYVTEKLEFSFDNPSGVPSFSAEVKTLQDILILTTEVPIEDIDVRNHARQLDVTLTNLKKTVANQGSDIRELKKELKK